MQAIIRVSRYLPVFALVGAVSGCTCQLSGTPLDTVTKSINPACWSSHSFDEKAVALPTVKSGGRRGPIGPRSFLKFQVQADGKHRIAEVVQIAAGALA